MKTKWPFLWAGIAAFVVAVFVCVDLTMKGVRTEITMSVLGAGFAGLLIGFGVFVYASTRDAQRNSQLRTDVLAPIPTGDLLMYFGVILAWEISLARFAIHLFSVPKQNALRWPSVVFTLFAIALTIFASTKAKRSFEALRSTKGRIALTGPQASLIVVIVMSLVVFLVWLLAKIFE